MDGIMTEEEIAKRLTVAYEIGRDIGTLAYGLEQNPDSLWIQKTITELRQYRDILATMIRPEFSNSVYVQLNSNVSKVRFSGGGENGGL